jgi:hypothetical protein
MHSCRGICFFAVIGVHAQTDTLVPLDNKPAAVILHAEIQLNDLTKVKGTVLHHSDSVVIIKTALMGEVAIAKSNIRSMYESRTGEARVRDTVRIETTSPELQKWPIDNSGYSLLFMPTAFMQPKGTIYFRDRELLFMNLDFSPFKRTSFSAGCLFPITFDFQMLTLGAKFQLAALTTESGTIAFAAAGNAAVTMFADVPYWSAGCVMSYRSMSGRLGFHGLLGIQGSQTGRVDFLYSEESNAGWDRNILYAIGTEGQITPRSKLIVELFNYAPFQDSANINYLSLGFRLFGERLSADIGAIEPLSENLSGVFLLIPYVAIACQIR